MTILVVFHFYGMCSVIFLELRLINMMIDVWLCFVAIPSTGWEKSCWTI